MSSVVEIWQWQLFRNLNLLVFPMSVVCLTWKLPDLPLCSVCGVSSIVKPDYSCPEFPFSHAGIPLHLAAYISFLVSPNSKWLWKYRASEQCSWGSASPRAWTERRALLNLGWNNPLYYSPILPSPYLSPRIPNWAGHQLSVFPKDRKSVV